MKNLDTPSQEPTLRYKTKVLDECAISNFHENSTKIPVKKDNKIYKSNQKTEAQ